jgi:type IX secretion system PorP/SprF family membrane protein
MHHSLIPKKINNVDMKYLLSLSKIAFLSSIILISGALTSNAQQELILTKYTYNSMFFNPAYAGSHGFNQGTALVHYRNQWIGFKGAPTTLVGGGEISAFNNRVGFGLGFAGESIGVESRADIHLNTAYRIPLKRGHLAGGLRFGFSGFNNDFAKVQFEQNEPNLYENYNLFSIGAGFYYNTDGLYVGISVPTLAVASKSKAIGDRVNHIYFHTGFMIGDEYSKVKFEPSVLFKFEQSVPLQFTFGVNAWFSDDFAIGAHFRSQDAIALSSELHFLKNYRVGLAYDFTTSDVRKYSDGTLEFLLGYTFNTTPNNPRIKSLRYGGRF